MSLSYSFALLSLINSLAFATEYQWNKVNVQLVSDLRATGRVVPQDGALHIESARIPGRILSILKKEGDTVAIGTPLFEISSGECLSLIEERKVLKGRDSSSLDELLQASERREKQLALHVTETKCEILATNTGVISKRAVESGSVFNIGDSLVTVVDLTHLAVELDIPEHDVAKVSPGQVVRLSLSSTPDQTYNSHILSVVPVVDLQSRTVRVRLSPVKWKSHPALDSLVTGEIETGHKEAIFKVPAESVIFNHNRQYVIKGPADKPFAIEVEVLSESEGNSFIRPVRRDQLKEDEIVVSKNAIFLFKTLNSGSLL